VDDGCDPSDNPRAIPESGGKSRDLDANRGRNRRGVLVPNPVVPDDPDEPAASDDLDEADAHPEDASVFPAALPVDAPVFPAALRRRDRLGPVAAMRSPSPDVPARHRRKSLCRHRRVRCRSVS
jgi:hypothetical protein